MLSRICVMRDRLAALFSVGAVVQKIAACMTEIILRTEVVSLLSSTPGGDMSGA